MGKTKDIQRPVGSFTETLSLGKINNPTSWVENYNLVVWDYGTSTARAVASEFHSAFILVEFPCPKLANETPHFTQNLCLLKGRSMALI